jgi:hypothetical protein
MLLSYEILDEWAVLHLAAVAGSFSSYITMALVCLLDVDPGTPGREFFRLEITKALSKLDRPESRLTLPAAVRRLVTLLKLLLDRPRVTHAERNVGAEPAGKRIKGGMHERLAARPVDGTPEDIRVRKTVRTLPTMLLQGRCSTQSSVSTQGRCSTQSSVSTQSPAVPSTTRSGPSSETTTPSNVSPAASSPFAFDFEIEPPAGGWAELMLPKGTGLDWSSLLNADYL